MATTETVQIPAVGKQGEPCAACGAPLAADQRYCLNCGRRRADPRLDFRGLLASPPPGESPPAQPGSADAAAASPPPPPAGREHSPLIAVGGIAVLGLMLLVGVLIGRGDDPQPITAPAPVVQTTEDATATGREQASTDASKSGSSDAAKGKEAKSGKKAKGGGGGSNAVPPPPPDAKVADDEFLKELNSKTGKAQQEASANLPDTIAIPGEPPKTDNKKPGGGSDSTVIK